MNDTKKISRLKSVRNKLKIWWHGLLVFLRIRKKKVQYHDAIEAIKMRQRFIEPPPPPPPQKPYRVMAESHLKSRRSKRVRVKKSAKKQVNSKEPVVMEQAFEGWQYRWVTPVHRPKAKKKRFKPVKSLKKCRKIIPKKIRKVF